MSLQRAKLLLDLARLVVKYGADEVLSLARDMRNQETVANLAALLEQVAPTVGARPTKPSKRRRRLKVDEAHKEMTYHVGTASDSKDLETEGRGLEKPTSGELERLSDAIVSKSARRRP